MNDIRKRKAIRDWNHWASHQALVLKNWRERGRAFARGNYVNRNIVWFAIWRYQANVQLLIHDRSYIWWAYPRGVHRRPSPSTVDEKEILQPLPSVEEIAVVIPVQFRN